MERLSLRSLATVCATVALAVAPAGAQVADAAPDRPAPRLSLLREGSRVSAARGRLERDDRAGRWRFIVAPSPGICPWMSPTR